MLLLQVTYRLVGQRFWSWYVYLTLPSPLGTWAVEKSLNFSTGFHFCHIGPHFWMKYFTYIRYVDLYPFLNDLSFIWYAYCSIIPTDALFIDSQCRVLTILSPCLLCFQSLWRHNLALNCVRAKCSKFMCNQLVRLSDKRSKIKLQIALRLKFGC